ncbi:MAG: tail fiber domain-containing protein [Bacteroidetes bacterium]|nr:tail fiber domain-containing protein [Bacteroidota bacterium]MCB0853341.1 tail fiber domain-containing protein [Bacteroidota bacterium]
MKYLLSLIAGFWLAQAIYAQAPQGFHYQAVARDGNSLLATHMIQVRFSILESNSVKYQELHSTSTNQYGIFNLVIGEGAVEAGDFLALDWGSGDYKLKVELEAGSGFKDLGTQDFKSVPFSLFAKRAASADRIQENMVSAQTPNVGDVLKWDGSAWVPDTDQGGPGYSAGSGISIIGNMISNEGDLNPNDDITNTSNAGGDVNGPFSNLLVQKIQGRSVSGAAPGTNQILKWNGSYWYPADDKTDAIWHENNNKVYYNLGSVGLGTSNPRVDLHLASGSILLVGQDTVGSGTKFIFDGNKGSLRAGRVFGNGQNSWDPDSIGLYSIGLGDNNTAKSTSSVAIGSSNYAASANAIAIGNRDTAWGQDAIALGKENRATATQAIVMGRLSVAEGYGSIAIGTSNTSSGTYSLAMGRLSLANATHSVAIGYKAQATASFSTAMGWETETCYNSFSIGRFNLDNGNQTLWAPSDRLFSIGNGSNIAFRSNAFAVYKDGDGYIQGNFFGLSDQRFKENIAPINQELDKLLKLRGVTYNWKDREKKGNQKQIGVIAQEVQEVFPELVSEREGHLAVNYIGLIPVLIEAIRDQQEMIDQLKQQVETLQKQ